jgi:6-phosphogluconolactonase
MRIKVMESILMTTPATIHQYMDLASLADATAQAIITRGNQAINERGRFTLALSGGSTPEPVYALLAERQDALDWSKVLLFWSDERTVPPNHPESNYGMAHDALISKVHIPCTVYRLRGEIDPQQAADEYEQTLREVFPDERWPRFDVMLLGMGDNAHTASLFPHTEALNERERLVVANYIPELNIWRLTFTAPLINAARNIMFLISGEHKAEPLRRVLQGEQNPQELPTQLIQPTDGELEFFLDEAAGRRLI